MHRTDMSRGDRFDYLYEVVGERVSSARRNKGLRQGHLADRVGVTRASIVNIEGGRKRPPLHLLWQIAASLDLDLHRLIPSADELATAGDPVQLEPQIVASIEKAAQNNPAAKKLLAD